MDILKKDVDFPIGERENQCLYYEGDGFLYVFIDGKWQKKLDLKVETVHGRLTNELINLESTIDMEDLRKALDVIDLIKSAIERKILENE